MNKFSSCLVAMLMLTGCDGTSVRYETSQIMHEEAIVEDAIYSPGIHGRADGVGIDMELNIQVTSTTIHVPPKYNVVFTCQHGRFVTDKEEIWKKVKKGGRVDLAYVEKRKLTVETRNGVTTIKNLEVYGYELKDVKAID